MRKTFQGEPTRYTFARIAHKAALKIRPEVAGDAEYWRLRESIVEALHEETRVAEAIDLLNERDAQDDHLSR